MDYSFAGHTRLTLFFDTPNHCGAALAMVGCALAAVAAVPGASGWPSRARMALLTATTAVAFAFLVQTYSRGAYVAAATTLLLFWVAGCGDRRRLFGFVLLLSTCVLAAPAGAQRAQAIVAMETDDSIANRLALWRGCLAIAWDNLPSGCGLTSLRQTFTAWYQEADRFQVYQTGVSDYATCAAAWGLPALAALLLILLSVVIAGYHASRCGCGGSISRAALAALVAYIVAAGFSTLFLSLAGIAGGIALVLIIGTIARCSAELDWRPVIRVGYASAGGLMLVLPAAAYACAKDFSVKPVTGRAFGLNRLSPLQVLVPRTQRERGIVLTIADRWFPEFDARALWRPLAEHGYTTVNFAPRGFTERDVRESVEILERIAAAAPGRPLFVVGSREGGRLALLVASAGGPPLRGVVAMSAPLWHPSPPLSPLARTGRNESPALLLYDPKSAHPNWSDAQRFAASWPSATVIQIADKPADAAAHWAAVQSPLIGFLEERLASQ
jgi:hypothetical protein